MRGEIEARGLVTGRLRPLRIKGRIIHQIGMPYHWSSKGLIRGDAANDLIAFVADPNVSIQESKALTAMIEPGRKSKGRRHVTSGPLVSTLPSRDDDRDLPPARHKAESKHGFKAAETKEGNISLWPLRRDSSRTPRFASAAMRAKSPVSSGINCRMTDSFSLECHTIIRSSWALPHGVMSRL